jgi:hypothetical protein
MAVIATFNATDHAQLMLLRQSAEQAGGGAYEGIGPDFVAPTPPPLAATLKKEAKPPK